MEEEQKQGKSVSDKGDGDTTFKKLMHNFMGYTTAHGVARLGDANTTFWKVFWSVVCIGAFGMFLFQVFGLFQLYLSTPVSTSISITFQKKMKFPAVTICNLNMLRRNSVPDAVRQALGDKVGYDYSEPSGGDDKAGGDDYAGGDDKAGSDDKAGGDGYAGGDGKADGDNHAAGTNSTESTNTTTAGTKSTDSTTTTTAGTNSTESTNTTTAGTKSTESTNSTTDFNDNEDGYDKSEGNGKNFSEGNGNDYSEDKGSDYGGGYDYNPYDKDGYNYKYDYGSDYDYYDGGFADVTKIDSETRLKMEVAQLVSYTEPEKLFYAGHLFDDFVQNCTWKGVDCKTGNASKYWKQSWNHEYGNCYTFNDGTDDDNKEVHTLSTSKPGPSQGLIVTLNIEQEHYIGPLSVEAGARILLHNQGETMFPNEEGFSVSPGMSTSIGIKKTKIVRLDRFNNGSCLKTDNLSDRNIYRIHLNVSVYSQQACLSSCLGSSQHTMCRCSEIAYPTGGRPCDIFNQTTARCLSQVRRLFNSDNLKCLADCRQPCTEEVIQKTISSSKWPSAAYKDYLNSQGKYVKNDDLLQIKIFFNALNYENIVEEISYGSVNLLADIGGQLGLWIGISVLTVCELIELLIKMFSHIVKKCQSRDKVEDIWLPHKQQPCN